MNIGSDYCESLTAKTKADAGAIAASAPFFEPGNPGVGGTVVSRGTHPAASASIWRGGSAGEETRPDAAVLRVLIVDNEALAAERLVRLCARLEGVEIAGLASDGETALRRIGELEPDVVLLDISMPGPDGLALARALKARGRRPAVVFVTAHDSFAVVAFELAATDYLLKPVSLPRLSEALARAAKSRPRVSVPASGHPTEIWAPRGQDMVRIGVETLDLVEAERDYVRLHAKGRTYLLRSALQEIERRLDPARFVRVHRSAIVAVDRIRAFTGKGGGWSVQLATGHTVPVSRSFRPVMRRIIAEGTLHWTH